MCLFVRNMSLVSHEFYSSSFLLAFALMFLNTRDVFFVGVSGYVVLVGALPLPPTAAAAAAAAVAVVIRLLNPRRMQ